MTVMSNAYGKIIANVEQLHRLMDEEGISAIVAPLGQELHLPGRVRLSRHAGAAGVSITCPFIRSRPS